MENGRSCGPDGQLVGDRGHPRPRHQPDPPCTVACARYHVIQGSVLALCGTGDLSAARWLHCCHGHAALATSPSYRAQYSGACGRPPCRSHRGLHGRKRAPLHVDFKHRHHADDRAHRHYSGRYHFAREGQRSQIHHRTSYRLRLGCLHWRAWHLYRHTAQSVREGLHPARNRA